MAFAAEQDIVRFTEFEGAQNPFADMPALSPVVLKDDAAAHTVFKVRPEALGELARICETE